MTNDHQSSFAIRRGQSHRPDLLVFEVIDKIDRPAIEGMAAAVDAAFEQYDQIDILIVMTLFEGADAAAVFDAKALNVEGRSLKHVGRYCVVGAPGWLEAMINVSGVLTPVETATFRLDELAEAHRWIDRAPD